MKTWKLVSGILSIVLSVFVLFQSAIAGLSNVLNEADEISGSAGFFVSVFMLTAGIVSIVTRKSSNMGGDIAIMVLCSMGSVLGVLFAGTSFYDLYVWAAWCGVCTLFAGYDCMNKADEIALESFYRTTAN